MSDSEYAVEHKRQGNPHVECNALYKTRKNLNCYLTASQAVELARHLLPKAQLIMEYKIENGVVHVWNQGEHYEKLYIGLNEGRKGERRARQTSRSTKKRQPVTTDN